MAIPDFQTIMLPLLSFAGDSKEHTLHEAAEFLAKEFKLSEAEIELPLASGHNTLFNNRVGWARTYMKKAGLLDSPRRLYFVLTQRGKDVLVSKPQRIDTKYLSQYPEFLEFVSRKKETVTLTPLEPENTPDEKLESAYQEIRQGLVSDLLQQIKLCSSSQFERIVVQLLVTMGYGGSIKDAGKAVGKSGDEGIDGIIKEDKLGLDRIYIQAKKWEGIIGRPEIQKFAGALQGQKARKGIFITTSDYTKEAQEFVEKIESKIVLIGGEQLAQFMIDHNLGVTPVINYEIKRLDSDYFNED